MSVVVDENTWPSLTYEERVEVVEAMMTTGHVYSIVSPTGDQWWIGPRGVACDAWYDRDKIIRGRGFRVWDGYDPYWDVHKVKTIADVKTLAEAVALIGAA